MAADVPLHLPVILDSEFARIEVDVDESGRGPRLRLTDLRTGHVRLLDPLEIETLMWLPEDAVRQLLDPSAQRWREDR